MHTNNHDLSLVKSKALPDGATTATSDAIDIGVNCRPVPVLLYCPALALTALPDTKTITYEIEASKVSTFATKMVVGSVVQTGATGTDPCLAVSIDAAVPADYRYVRFTATGVATVAASGSSAILGVSVPG